MHFPPETLTFLRGIAEHNDKAWFEDNRRLYEAGYVQPGIAFVEAVGPQLRAISADVQFVAKVNGSVSRINRDIRFSKDKRPYKNHLGLWFWHGDKKSWNAPGFYFHVSAEEVFIAVGKYGFDKDALETFRSSIVLNRSGNALVDAVAKVRAVGDYQIGEKTRKLMPRGFEAPADRAEYLLYEGLTASIRLPASDALEAGFSDRCVAHFAAEWPVGQWLMTELGA
ncbi:DUF2461 domain-containing protein [Devosia sp. SL43]|uniref:DUF2461 domain-containing protein n=1 Tax=Devosia sp. SL43 TaxID=2806348 RepID=UPI001F476364|nr:DUF2461 domain-containing protein [Devosia sp. SL43]UJW86778.1 DUF2461 domain-containing protein [Devosia sp. SL43]